MGLLAERKKTWVQEGEVGLDVAGVELVGVVLAGEAKTDVMGGIGAANLGHQVLVVPGEILLVEKPAISVPQVQYVVLLKL